MRAVFLPLVLVIAVASVSLSQTTSGEWTYALNASNEATIFSYSGAGGAVEIPSSIDGNQVRKVGSGGSSVFAEFGPNYSVTSVTIPESVWEIGNTAFASCRGMTNVKIGNGVVTLGLTAFSGCSALTSVTIPDSVTVIREWAFSDCSALTSVTIPDSVEFIGNQAFGYCSALTSVRIPQHFLTELDQIFDRAVASQAMIQTISRAIVAALPNNYGIATKSDLGTAVSNAISQTVSQVQANPNDYSLYSADQHATNYSKGVTAGTSLVTANPASYNLYTSNSIMDLRMGGVMVQKQGSNAVVTFQPQTTTDLTQPFTNNGTPITNTIPMPSSKGFLRIRANPTPTPPLL